MTMLKSCWHPEATVERRIDKQTLRLGAPACCESNQAFKRHASKATRSYKQQHLMPVAHAGQPLHGCAKKGRNETNGSHPERPHETEHRGEYEGHALIKPPKCLFSTCKSRGASVSPTRPSTFPLG